jgi:tetratricopeptide (TPR) repeat protein
MSRHCSSPLSSCQSKTNDSSVNDAANNKSEIKIEELTAEKLVEMAKLSNKISDFENAIKYLSLAIKKNPNNPEAYYERAYAWVGTDSSVSDYKKCIKLNFKVTDCYYALTVNYLEKNDSLANIFLEKT